MSTGATHEIRGHRSARPVHATDRAQGHELEWVREPDGTRVRALTLFLTGAECPFTCVFCDLWQYTLDGATPAGAIPQQIERALEELDEPLAELHTVKLYNASNWFDRRAVPPADDARVLELLTSFSRITVESHPRLIGERCLRFADAAEGRLEVALGLETVHPDVLPRLNKDMDLSSFQNAVETLRGASIGVRCFVQVGLPYMPDDEQVAWTVRSVQFAAECGADRVAIIPTRPGNGSLERLADQGEFAAPTLRQLELTLEECLSSRDGADARPASPTKRSTPVGSGPGPRPSGPPTSSNIAPVVTADLWDLERLDGCSNCAAARRERLATMNDTGTVPGAVDCPGCENEVRP